MTKLLDAIVAKNGGIKKGAVMAFEKTSGIPHPTLYRWCGGKPVDERYREKLAKGLGITVAELMKLLPPKEPGDSRGTVIKGIPVKIPVIGIISNADEFEYNPTACLWRLTVMTENGENGLLAYQISGDKIKGFDDGDLLTIAPDAYVKKSFVVLKNAIEKSGLKYALFMVLTTGQIVTLKSLMTGKIIKIPAASMQVVGVVKYMMRKMF